MRTPTTDLRVRYYDFKQPGFIKPKIRPSYKGIRPADVLVDEAYRRHLDHKGIYRRWFDWICS